jgi:hypothetical protein
MSYTGSIRHSTSSLHEASSDPLTVSVHAPVELELRHGITPQLLGTSLKGVRRMASAPIPELHDIDDESPTKSSVSANPVEAGLKGDVPGRICGMPGD